jgi:hypothetical protein
MGLQGGMKRNSDTVTACNGIAHAGQLGLVAFRKVRMAACCNDEPDGQHPRRHAPARHAMAVNDAPPKHLPDKSAMTQRRLGNVGLRRLTGSDAASIGLAFH